MKLLPSHDESLYIALCTNTVTAIGAAVSGDHFIFCFSFRNSIADVTANARTEENCEWTCGGKDN